MNMQDVFLCLDGGDRIPVRISTSSETTLIECDEPLPFLDHVTQGRWGTSLTPDTYLRGCILPREGALFCLCDQFGMVADNVARLTFDQAKQLIFDRIS